ncbi:MAG: hypothetical protein FWE41_08505 [Coriobacteriia bacterium]|nr:hypothetical protein [Coriobacteriia bacterium]MCL2750221.1 hypothetical protein [Coriobacteriia bacterium]
MRQKPKDYSDQAMMAGEGDETFKGASFNSLVTAGFAASIDNVIDTSKQEALWQGCLEKAPEITTIAAALCAKQSAFKTVVTGTAAIVVALGAGFSLIWSTIQYQESSPVIMEALQPLFIPESVEIYFVNGNPALPEIYNPHQATIELSEGVAQEWCILDSAQGVVTQGAGAVIGPRAFEGLVNGVYQIKWTVADEDGNIGYAYREFIIEK